MPKEFEGPLFEAKNKLINVGIITLLAVVTVPSAVKAAPASCGPRNDILAQLHEKYRETPAAVGLAHDGTLVEVLTNEDGSTWSIMLSQPGGVSCLVATGESWQELNPRQLGIPSGGNMNMDLPSIRPGSHV